MEEIKVMVADASHEKYVDTILQTIADAAKVRGTGIAKRTHEYLTTKMKEAKAVIALSGDRFAGFSYIETWGNKQYVTTSGLIVHTLSGGDITHAVPDNTGYITEGQLFLRRDSDIGKVIVDPFRSLSRLKQLVSGKKTRKDHPQVMNAAVRLYADAANAKTKMENGFDLTNYDERTLAFAKDYANQLLAIDVNLDTTEMLDVTWGLFSKYFKPEEVNIKKELVDQHWKKQ